MALWWVPAGHLPTIGEAEERLAHLRVHGPTPHAFTIKHRFPHPGDRAAQQVTVDDREFCPAG
jgi:hypothetical protein